MFYNTYWLIALWTSNNHFGSAPW